MSAMLRIMGPRGTGVELRRQGTRWAVVGFDLNGNEHLLADSFSRATAEAGVREYARILLGSEGQETHDHDR